jgi:hypothetical protein
VAAAILTKHKSGEERSNTNMTDPDQTVKLMLLKPRRSQLDEPSTQSVDIRKKGSVFHERSLIAGEFHLALQTILYILGFKVEEHDEHRKSFFFFFF